MTDHNHHAETRQQNMLAGAEELTQLREGIEIPANTDELPTLAHASRQLSDLARLLQVLAAQTHRHARADQSATDRGDEDEAAYYWAWAAQQLSAAASRYASACHNIAQLRRNPPQQGENPNRPHLRRTAFIEAQQDIADTRNELPAVRSALEMGAEHFEEASAVSEAARARSAHPGRVRTPTPVEAEAPTTTPPQEHPHAREARRAR